MYLSKPIVGGIALLLIVAGVIAGHYIGVPTQAATIDNAREESGNYKFIKPLLYVTIPESTSPAYLALKKDVASYADAAISKKKATDISVYVRDLDSGEWVGYQPDKTYSAASMLKVVTLIATLRLAESDPSLLTKRVHIPADFQKPNPQDFYPPKDPLKAGSTYTVSEILNRLITQSDNTANDALYQIVGKEAVAKAFNDLHLPYDETGKLDGIDTAHDYSHLFRALFNATYLTREDSEKALELLSHADFADGIVAGVPDGTVVSHKFGERGAQPPSNAKELHDCGVVYYPDRPYFICVMTRGTDYPTLASVISDVSKLVWTDFDAKLSHPTP